MNKMAIVGLGMAMSVGCVMASTETSHANVKGEQFYTTASVLNLRKGPGTSHNVIGKLVKNTQVTKIGSEKGFAKVEVKLNGRTVVGFASENYLAKKVATTTTTNAQVKKGTHVVNAKSGLNVRTGAGTSFRVYKTLPKGTKVEVSNDRTKRYNKIDWAEIKIDGYKYYVDAQYLTKVDTSTQATKPEVKPVVTPDVKADAFEGVLNGDMPGFKHEHSDNCVKGPLHTGNLDYEETTLDTDVILYADPCNEVNKSGALFAEDAIKVYYNVVINDEHGARVLIGQEYKTATGTNEMTGYIYCSDLPQNTGNSMIDFLRSL